MTFRGTLS